MSVGENIKKYRILSGMTQQEVADRLHITRQAIFKYENSIVTNVPIDKIEAMARLFDVSPADLMGWAPEAFKNIVPLPRFGRVPIIGAIACGDPITAIKESDEYFDGELDIKADFALRCVGNSMEPLIDDGSLVFCRQQNDVDDGQIAAVIIDDEATLKRVFKYPDRVVLQPENTAYKPLVYTESDCVNVRIIGLAVKVLYNI